MTERRLSVASSFAVLLATSAVNLASIVLIDSSCASSFVLTLVFNACNDDVISLSTCFALAISDVRLFAFVVVIPSILASSPVALDTSAVKSLRVLASATALSAINLLISSSFAVALDVSVSMSVAFLSTFLSIAFSFSVARLISSVNLFDKLLIAVVVSLSLSVFAVISPSILASSAFARATSL